MRLVLVFTLLLMSNLLAAQHRLTGRVTDGVTRNPVAFAVVGAHGAAAYTNSNGVFTLNLISMADTITVNAMGYKPYKVNMLGKALNDTVRVKLDQVSIMLKDVAVGGKRDARADSVRNRRLFSSVYNYKGTTVKDAFVDKGSLTYKPADNINNPNNTTAIGGVNLLSVLSLLTKNNTTQSKLKKDMLRDEEGAYVDRRFSKQKVAALTTLRGDSLQKFIFKYRPTVNEVKQMTDYDIIIYIKKSYASFSKP